MAIATGDKPLFFANGFSWDPYLYPRRPTASKPNPNPAAVNNMNPPSSTPSLSFCPKNETADPRLRNTLADLQEFARAANLAFQTGRKIPADVFRETLVSVQYRLLALRDEERPRQLLQSESGGPSDLDVEDEELLRLGMLAFSTTVFLRIEGMPMRYGDLAGRVRGVVTSMAEEEVVSEGESESESERGRLVVWFLFVAGVSVLRDVEDQEMLAVVLKRVLGGLGSSGWEEVRDVLKGVMWIDWVHSAGGRKLWEAVV